MKNDIDFYLINNTNTELLTFLGCISGAITGNLDSSNEGSMKYQKGFRSSTNYS